MSFKEVRDALLVQLAMPLNLSDLKRHQQTLSECFKEKRPHRERQMTRLRKAVHR